MNSKKTDKQTDNAKIVNNKVAQEIKQNPSQTMIQDIDWSRYRPVIIPTPDFSCNFFTMLTLFQVGMKTNNEYSFDFLVSKSNNPVPSRQLLFEQLKMRSGQKVLRGFFIDSDSMISPEPKIVDKLINAMKRADREHFSFVVPYRVVKNEDVSYTAVFSNEGKLMSVEDVKQLFDFDKILSSGLGFYYGDLPLDYKFRFGDDRGEDWWFFKENNIDLRILKMPCYHVKTMVLPPVFNDI